MNKMILESNLLGVQSRGECTLPSFDKLEYYNLNILIFKSLYQ